MDNVDRAFSDYVHAHRATRSVDPSSYLGRVDDDRHAELVALIDGYLVRQPRRTFDPEAFAGSYAANVSDSLHRSLHGRGGMWPVALPALRRQAGLSQEALIPRLASALGASNEQEKVAAYYHEMERGSLAAGGVSDRVLSALAEIVNTTPAALRATGAPADPAVEDAAAGTASGAIEPPDWLPARSDSSWNEVDELFHPGD